MPDREDRPGHGIAEPGDTRERCHAGRPRDPHRIGDDEAEHYGDGSGGTGEDERVP